MDSKNQNLDSFEEYCAKGDSHGVDAYLTSRPSLLDSQYFRGVYSACYAGETELIKRFVKLRYFPYEHAMMYAAQGGHLDVIRALVDALQKSPRQLDLAINTSMFGAYVNGDPNVIAYLKTLGTLRPGDCLMGASAGGHLDLVNELLATQKLKTEELNWSLNKAVEARKNAKEIMQNLITAGATNSDSAFINACLAENFTSMEFLSDKIKNLQCVYQALFYATKDKKQDIITWLRSKWNLTYEESEKYHIDCDFFAFEDWKKWWQSQGADVVLSGIL